MSTVYSEKSIESKDASKVLKTLNLVRVDPILTLLFTCSILLSASLLFIVQPMVGKILLPKLGGVPSVWNTCMVFFQAVLLGGYLTAHLLSRYCSLRNQILIFAVMLMGAAMTLPLSVGMNWDAWLMEGTNPSLWLLCVLTVQVAPVFFALSMTSPLLQNWFAQSGHKQAHDPYFLYAASNVGSIFSLLLYPLWLESQYGVVEQTLGWKNGFLSFVVLLVVSGFVGWLANQRPKNSNENNLEVDAVNKTNSVVEEKLSWSRRGRWVLLAMVPSSLMLGVTTHFTSDIAAVPLFWVLPLTIYLLTFVIAFSRYKFVSLKTLSYAMGVFIVLGLALQCAKVVNSFDISIIPKVVIHLGMFSLATLFCHQRLADDRPSTNHLTEFFLWLSVGGVIGGILNALVAPYLFTTLLEYPLILVFALFLRMPSKSAESESKRGSLMEIPIPFLVTLIGLGVLHGLLDMTVGTLVSNDFLSSSLGASITISLVLVVPTFIFLHFLKSPMLFATCNAALLVFSLVHQYQAPDVLIQGRNFYSTLTIKQKELDNEQFIAMTHGHILHGTQWADEAKKRVPTTYYGSRSGVNQIFFHLAESDKSLKIGAIGLGTGTVTAILRPEDRINYYEINPQVVEYAEEYFTYLSDARERGTEVDMRLGDARMVMASEKESKEELYDLLILDAFSGDSIPTHLLTDECMAIYSSRIKENGVLAIHVSNLYLDLEPVVAELAHAHGLNAFLHTVSLDKPLPKGEQSSRWMLLSRDADRITSMKAANEFRTAKRDSTQRLWTDDYTNVLKTMSH